MKFFKIFDSFGLSIDFTIIQSSRKYKTAFGGILSIAIGIIWIILFFNFGQNCFYKRNPTGYSQLLPTEANANSALNLTENSFIYGFQLKNEDWKLIHFEEYFHAIFSFRENIYRDDILTINRTILKVIPCDQVKMDKKIDLNNYNLSLFYCPDFSNVKGKTLGGYIDNGLYTNMEFNLRLCDENNSNCKNRTKIEELKKHQTLWIDTIYPVVKYDINDLKESLDVDITMVYNLVNPFGYTLTEYYFSEYESDTDMGAIFNSVSKEKAIGLSKITFTTDPKNELPEKVNEKKEDMLYDGSNIYTTLITYEKKKHYYSRWFDKVPDVLARTSGVIKILILFFSIVYSFYSKFSFNSFLCEELIYVDDESEETKNKLRNFFNLENNNENKNNNENNEINLLKNNDDDKKHINIPYRENLKNDLNQNKHVISNQKNSNESKPINDSDKLRERHLQKNRQTAKEYCLKYFEMKEINKNKNQINDNSQRNLIEDEAQKEKEKIKSQLESIINKYSATKNSFDFKILKILLGAICPKKYPTENKHKRIISYFGKKFNEKFDIFYYFKQDKINKLIENIVMTKEQNRLKDLITRKNYSININNDEIEEKIDDREEENKLILEYLLSDEEKVMEKSDDVLIENLLL